MVGDGMVGSTPAITRETRQCRWARWANSPRAWLPGVRASVVAKKRVTTVEPWDAGRWKCEGQKRRDQQNQRAVPARANRWWNPTEHHWTWVRLERPRFDALWDEAKSRSLSQGAPTDWRHADAGDPPVRFGEGGGHPLSLPLSPLALTRGAGSRRPAGISNRLAAGPRNRSA